ncbi:MAG: glycosyltransferase [Cellvibrionales bacterium]|nr:glycosyltransferase [Cellvibrionales bacterium]
MQTLVTVYIPTHNRKHLVTRAIDSVLAQTYSPIEIIVVDDGSQDGTEEHLNEYIQSGKIHFIRNIESKGACYSRNIAIKAAKGKFITGLDDDDVFTQDRITQFIQASNNNDDCAFLYSGYQLKQPSGTKYWSKGGNKQSHSDLLKRNRTGNQVFARRERLLAVGGFDESLPAWQDHDLWIRLTEKYSPAQKVDKPTYIVDTTHSHERISTNLTKVKNAHDIFKQKHLHYSQPQYRRFLELNYYQYPGVPFPLKKYLAYLPSSAAKRATKIYIDKFIARIFRKHQPQ